MLFLIINKGTSLYLGITTGRFAPWQKLGTLPYFIEGPGGSGVKVLRVTSSFVMILGTVLNLRF
jgi:hypothetical protein